MLQYTILSYYDVPMAKRKVEACYCTTPGRFTMRVMVVQQGGIQADHNATSKERDILWDVEVEEASKG